MSVRHQAGLREKRKLGARLYDTGGAFLETMYDCTLRFERVRGGPISAMVRTTSTAYNFRFGATLAARGVPHAV